MPELPEVETVRRGLAPAMEGARVDKAGTIHLAIGKLSFDAQKLVDNIQALLDAIVRAKPATSKGTYLKKISLSTTMGPGMRIDPASCVTAQAA